MVNRKMPAAAFSAAWGADRRVWLLEAERFGLDGGAMFGVVPRVVWERSLPPDVCHRVPLVARCLVIQQQASLAVVDCGLGNSWDATRAERLGLAASPRTLGDGLKELGLRPQQVTHVVLTHLHFDHAGGLLRQAEGGPLPAFPEAQVIVQGAAWERARSPSARDRASFRALELDWLAGSGRLRLVSGAREVLPGVSVHPCQGHTDGMQVVTIQGPGGSLLYAADLIPTQHHVRLAWHMGFDLRPLETLSEKQHWLRWAGEHDAWVALEHDPDVAAVRVRARRGGDYEVSERLTLV